MSQTPTLEQLARDWAIPRFARHGTSTTPFRLSCSLAAGPAPQTDIAGLSVDVPRELESFWRAHRAARLFEDVQFGQWGLELLGPGDAVRATQTLLAARPRDYRAGDLVIGRFLGDSDCLMVRADRSTQDYGSVQVVLPLDPRAEWYRVSPDLDSFLRNYFAAQGAKFWEAGVPNHVGLEREGP